MSTPPLSTKNEASKSEHNAKTGRAEFGSLIRGSKNLSFSSTQGDFIKNVGGAK